MSSGGTTHLRNGSGVVGGPIIPFASEEEWQNAIAEAKDALAAAYALGKIDIPQPVDSNLSKLAAEVAGRVIRSVN